MLVDTPNIDGSSSGNQSLPEDLPIRRIGLEQEFFKVRPRQAWVMSKQQRERRTESWHE